MDFWIDRSPWDEEDKNKSNKFDFDDSKLLEDVAWRALDNEVIRIYALVKMKNFSKEELDHLLSVILTHAKLNSDSLRRTLEEKGYAMFLDDMKNFFKED